MPKFESRIDVQGPAATRNRGQWLARIAEWRALERRSLDAAHAAEKRFRERGQLMPQERVALLLDTGSSWLQLSSLAGYAQEVDDPRKSIPGGGTITGIGVVSGVRCLISATNSAIAAGARQPMGLEKQLRAMDIALEQKLPFVHLVESAGANLLTYQVEHFIRGGGLYYRLAKLSAAGNPLITIVHGASTAGGAYMPGMSDYVVMVRNRSRAFLAGPALLKAATGEEADEETIGGAEMHATISGLAEYLAEDDRDAIRLARELIGLLEWERAMQSDPGDPPACAAEELLDFVPLEARRPYDVREVLARIVDGSVIADFKPLYGAATVCAHARLASRAVGFIGNNGPLDPAGANKATHFIQLCCQSGTPLIFLHNTTGYIVGVDSERGGMIKHGSKMIQAVANANVPRIALHIGASVGAGNYGMCGRAFNPDFAFTWPNANTTVMGGEQAALTMEFVARAAAKRRGASLDEAMLAEQHARIVAGFERQADAFYTSGLLLDDGIIDPRDTRAVLGMALDLCASARRRSLRPVQFGVARP
ncbi:MAG: acyl-CoA carboxylase subunit beta [Betaproteobacteria bacterium]|nr:acyl-CoA carboxylase subunit beta [Betaproteobacteria bacterium]